jgi:hypothetical protein
MWIKSTGGSIHNTRSVNRFYIQFNPTVDNFYIKFEAPHEVEYIWRKYRSLEEAQADLEMLLEALNKGQWVFQKGVPNAEDGLRKV